MTMSRVEVITSVQRRRRWSREEKERLVAACLEPGVSVSHVARRAGIHSSQLFRWRRELCRRVDAGAPQLIPVEIAPSPERRCGTNGLIEIALDDGRYVRVDRDVDADALRRVLDVLERR